MPYPTLSTSMLKPNPSLLSSSFCSFVAIPLVRIGTKKLPSEPGRSFSRAPVARLLPLRTGLRMEVIDVPLTPDVEPTPQNENPVLLFVHGTLHGAWCFKYFQQYFADQGFSTKAISLRGCGESEIAQTSSSTVSQHIDDLNEAIPKLAGSASSVIVAHSMGGFLIQKWMEQNSEVSVAGLVLMASTPPTGNSSIIKRLFGKLGLWNWLKLSIGFIRQSASRDLSFCREVFFSKKDSDGFSEEVEGDQRLQEYMEQFKKTKLTINPRSLKDVVESTGGYNGKVMVLHATEDMIVDEEANQETAEFWNGDLKMVQNAPHDLMLYSNWEKPARLILEWIQENVIRQGHSVEVSSSLKGVKQ